MGVCCAREAIFETDRKSDKHRQPPSSTDIRKARRLRMPSTFAGIVDDESSDLAEAKAEAEALVSQPRPVDAALNSTSNSFVVSVHRPRVIPLEHKTNGQLRPLTKYEWDSLRFSDFEIGMCLEKNTGTDSSQVFAAHVKQHPECKVAIRVMEGTDSGGGGDQKQGQEVRDMTQLWQHVQGHAGILPLCKVEHDPDSRRSFIFMPYASSLSLESFLRQNGPLSERWAAQCIAQVVSALLHMHQRGVVHLNVSTSSALVFPKQSNQRLVNPTGNSRSNMKVRTLHRRAMTSSGNSVPFQTVLGSFGKARWCEPEASGVALMTLSGCSAPELLIHNSYSQKSDVWSVGVMTFIVLGGYNPFNPGGDLSSEQMRQSIELGEFQFAGRAWDRVSRTARDFIRMCLTVDYRCRPDMRDLLKSSFLLSAVDSVHRDSSDQPDDFQWWPSIDSTTTLNTEALPGQVQKPVAHEAAAAARASNMGRLEPIRHRHVKANSWSPDSRSLESLQHFDHPATPDRCETSSPHWAGARPSSGDHGSSVQRVVTWRRNAREAAESFSASSLSAKDRRQIAYVPQTAVFNVDRHTEI